MTAEIKTGEKMIVFMINGKEYAISVSQVKSIEKWQKPTRVPGVESYIRGVINLRGVITPVLDLRKRLNQPEQDITEETRIIIISYRDADVGWVVDEANDVITVHENEIESAPESQTKEADVWIKQIVKQDNRLLNIIDAHAVLDKGASASASGEPNA
ncbi:chemotaxis protein CheW [Bacillus sp. L381]|jgi:purine-binding chemotaxis protein CheW|uniref:Chemotaxis protein CheW n=2 Tax=Bacillus amyloliquefaciens TaxID=1390 RepID=A0A9P1JH27_BACAS|nr:MULTISPECIES: chemotaxis protein CheW [Bacillus]AIW33648.1 chemotaxis protein CheW [Bacillus subtilis]AEB23953.1 modulation of CheA activity in response to attractants (chemotaxis) [Bacillus amyloliquefaciens TA208]AEB63344.1 modulation of CheA activity in response to attractants (chemotaxis) [Bacillus amyloliquefaciens LL3]AEK88949.1 chemotaxis protein [Bacillus amyloliquefaciens XH7]ARW38920.1 Chemotaxis protein CheW [Bacillus amyloliquefaciens]